MTLLGKVLLLAWLKDPGLLHDPEANLIAPMDGCGWAPLKAGRGLGLEGGRSCKSAVRLKRLGIRDG